MSEVKNEVNSDKEGVAEQKETNKELTKPLSPEEIESLKENAHLIEDFGKYLGQEWKKKLEQGTPEEISTEYQKLGALFEEFKQFLQEREQLQEEEGKRATEMAKQYVGKLDKQYLPGLDEYFDKQPLEKKNNIPFITLENAFGVRDMER